MTEVTNATYGEAKQFESESAMVQDLTGKTELTETQQQLLGEFVNATVRKVLPVTIIGEKATCVFRHVFGFVDNYQYGVDETGNVVVQDMASGNYGMIEGNVLCSLISVYENEIAACKKDEVKQIEPDLLKEAGLV